MKILSNTNNNRYFSSNGKSENFSFKGALINMNVLSDIHGNTQYANNAMEEMQKNRQDIFSKEEKGRLNILAVGGDWFMDGGRTGYQNNPKMENGKFQLAMLNGFINQCKQIASNLQTIFVPGNHEFDGGYKLADEIFSKMNADIISTNLNKEDSTAFQKSNNKILNEKVYEVEDDKNPGTKYKLLVLGISPVNMDAYQKNSEGVSFIDNINKPSKNIEEQEYKKTFDECYKRIAKFKQENPNGLVAILSHTGVEFADNLAKKCPVNIIFDGHEHKDDIRIVNKVPIIPLGQNFHKIVNSKIIINDQGDIKQIVLKNMHPRDNKNIGPLDELYKQLYQKDLEKNYSLYAEEKLNTKDIREGNNFLANFVTDSILEEIQKDDPSVDFFALNSSSIRSGLDAKGKESISNFDVINVLSGIRTDEGQIMTTEVSGSDLLYMVKDNLMFNRINPNRNSIIQYSMLSVDKTGMLAAIDRGEDEKELYKYITDERTNTPIKAKKEYKIANPVKYFDKSYNNHIKEMKNISEYKPYTVQELFRKHFENAKEPLIAKCNVRYI